MSERKALLFPVILLLLSGCAGGIPGGSSHVTDADRPDRTSAPPSEERVRHDTPAFTPLPAGDPVAPPSHVRLHAHLGGLAVTICAGLLLILFAGRRTFRPDPPDPTPPSRHTTDEIASREDEGSLRRDPIGRPNRSWRHIGYLAVLLTLAIVSWLFGEAPETDDATSFTVSLRLFEQGSSTTRADGQPRLHGRRTGLTRTPSYGSWTEDAITTGTDNEIRDADAAKDGSRFAVAVGENGNFWHWQGTSWTERNAGTSDLISDVAVLSSAFAIATSSGTVWMWQGTTWRVAYPNTGGSATYTTAGIAIAGTDFAVVGHPDAATTSNQIVLRWTGTTWIRDGSFEIIGGWYRRNIAAIREGSDEYAVVPGWSGFLLHWTGTTWLRGAIATTTSSYAADYLSTDFGFTVGNASTSAVARWTGTSWVSHANGLGGTYQDVSVFSTTFAMAVGDAGDWAWWTGTSWLRSPGYKMGVNDLWEVEVYGTDYAIATGDGGEIWRWTGTTWTFEHDEGTIDMRNGGNADGTFLVASGGGGEETPNGTASNSVWRREVTDPQHLDWYREAWTGRTAVGISAMDDERSVVADDAGHLSLWTGTTWYVWNARTQAFSQIAMGSSTLGFALVDSKTYLWQWTGTSWAARGGATAGGGSNGIHGSNVTSTGLPRLAWSDLEVLEPWSDETPGNTLAFLVGGGGDGSGVPQIFTWRGTSWIRHVKGGATPVPEGTGHVSAAASDFAVATMAEDPGATDWKLFDWRGTSWHFRERHALTELAMDLHLASTDFGIIASKNGWLWTWQGTTWMPKQVVSTTNEFLAVGGDRSDFAVAVGGGGLAWRWTGTDWQDVSPWSGGTFHRVVAGSTPTHWAVAVGDSSKVFRWTGTTWTDETVATHGNPIDLLDAMNGDFVLAAGDQAGEIWKRHVPGIAYDNSTLYRMVVQISPEDGNWRPDVDGTFAGYVGILDDNGETRQFGTGATTGTRFRVPDEVGDGTNPDIFLSLQSSEWDGYTDISPTQVGGVSSGVGLTGENEGHVDSLSPGGGNHWTNVLGKHPVFPWAEVQEGEYVVLEYWFRADDTWTGADEVRQEVFLRDRSASQGMPQIRWSSRIGAFLPRIKTWRWFVDAASDPSTATDALAAETTAVTGVGTLGDRLRLRLRVDEQQNGASSGSPAWTVQWSTDQSSWTNVTTTSSGFRLFGGQGTAGGAVGARRLAGSDTDGIYIEDTSSNTKSIGAKDKMEFDVALESWQATTNQTYYFRLAAGGAPVALDSGASYPRVTTLSNTDFNFIFDRAYGGEGSRPIPLLSSTFASVYMANGGTDDRLYAVDRASGAVDRSYAAGGDLGQLLYHWDSGNSRYNLFVIQDGYQVLALTDNGTTIAANANWSTNPFPFGASASFPISEITVLKESTTYYLYFVVTSYESNTNTLYKVFATDGTIAGTPWPVKPGTGGAADGFATSGRIGWMGENLYVPGNQDGYLYQVTAGGATVTQGPNMTHPIVRQTAVNKDSANADVYVAPEGDVVWKIDSTTMATKDWTAGQSENLGSTIASAPFTKLNYDNVVVGDLGGEINQLAGTTGENRKDGDVRIWDHGASTWTSTFTNGDPIDRGTANAVDVSIWPVSAVDSAGRVYVAFIASNGSENHLYLSRYDGSDVKIWDNGAPGWTDTFANGDPIDKGTADEVGSSDGDLAIAIDSADRVYIAYSQELSSSDYMIYLSRYDGTDVRIWDHGAATWTTTFADGDPVSDGAQDAFVPRLAIDGLDRVYIGYSRLVFNTSHGYLLSRYDGTNVAIWDNGASSWTTTLASGDPINKSGGDADIFTLLALDASRHPGLVVDASDRVYLAHWIRESAINRLYLSRYDGTDVKIWDTGAPGWTDTFDNGDPIDNGGANLVTDAVVGKDGSDRIYVAFSQSDGSNQRLYLSRYDGTDVRIWDNGASTWTTTFTDGDPIDVGNAVSGRGSLALGVDASDRVYIPHVATNGSENHIYLTRYDGTDAKIWDNGASAWTDTFANADPIDKGTAHVCSTPDLAIDGAARVWVSYIQSDGSVNRVHLSRYDGTDVKIWDNGLDVWTDTFANGDPVDNGSANAASQSRITVETTNNRPYWTYFQSNGSEAHAYLSRHAGNDFPVATNGTPSTVATVWNSFMYFGTTTGRCYCIDTRDGTSPTNWPFAVPGSPEIVGVATDVIAGVVYFTADNGRVYSFDLQ